MLASLCVLLIVRSAKAADTKADANAIFARDNLVAWCIVPFDAKQRTPEQRAEMLARIGLKRFAYDWRGQHLPTFDAEIAALKRHRIELTAVWFPAQLDADARTILAALERHKLTPQLWVSAGAAETGNDEQRVAAAADVFRPIATEAARIGCTVGV